MRKKILIAGALQYSAYIVMQTFCLIAETTRGPSLPDRLHEWIAPQRHLNLFNSTIWLPGVLIFILVLGTLRPAACVNYLRVGAAMTLFRGIFIYLTTLGPPQAVLSSAPKAMLDLKLADITPLLLLRQWMPLDVLYGGGHLSAAHLTQDMFFSGHTSTTFLFILVLARRDWLFWPVLFFHLMTILLLILTHEHYTIDILGAYFVVYACFAFFEKRGWLEPVHAEAAKARKDS